MWVYRLYFVLSMKGLYKYNLRTSNWRNCKIKSVICHLIDISQYIIPCKKVYIFFVIFESTVLLAHISGIAHAKWKLNCQNHHIVRILLFQLNAIMFDDYTSKYVNNTFSWCPWYGCYSVELQFLKNLLLIDGPLNKKWTKYEYIYNNDSITLTTTCVGLVADN